MGARTHRAAFGHSAAAQIHPSLLEPARTAATAGLPFALESTLHERPPSAASRLSGLDGLGARRALHAMHHRPRGRLYHAHGLFGEERPLFGNQLAARTRPDERDDDAIDDVAESEADSDDGDEYHDEPRPSQPPPAALEKLQKADSRHPGKFCSARMEIA